MFRPVFLLPKEGLSMVEIVSNGSKFFGQAPDNISDAFCSNSIFKEENV